jgi:hypothetical protein
MALERPFKNCNLSVTSYIQRGNRIFPTNPGVKRKFYFGNLN